MKPLVLPLLFFFPCSFLFAQMLTSGAETAWGKGTITLNTGEKLTGQISYNDVGDVITYRAPSSRENKIFHRSDVLVLEYQPRGVNRKYYSLILKDRMTGDEDDGFYEMIKEYYDFAVVSKMSFTFLEKTANIPLTGFTKVQKGILRRSEEIYFLDKNGDLDPYLFIDHGYMDGGFDDPERKNGKVIDKTLFQKYFGTYWPEISRYIENDKMHIHNRDNLLCVLSLYDALLAEPVFNFPAGIFMDSTLLRRDEAVQGVD